jgi:hypothetical protein
MVQRLFAGLAALAGFAFAGVVQADDAVKVKPAEVVKMLDGVKIISIQDVDKFNAIDQEGMSGVWGNSPVKEYDRDYPKRLKESLGIELVVVRSGELLEEMGKVEEKAIEEMADKWIREATEMKNVKRNDILRSARMYWAFKALLKKYSAVAITYESATLTLSEHKVNAWTPLSILELAKEHIPCCCQSHVDCLVTQLIGRYLTDGRTGFVGDVLNDWAFKAAGDRPKNIIVIGHCGAPINPHGNDRIPYLLRDHIHSDKKWSTNPTDVAEASTVTWPADEPATVVKFDVFRKKVSIFPAKVLDGNKVFVDFPNCICRNKMLVQIDQPEGCYLLPSDPKQGAFRSWWGSWGCHQVVFYGELADAFKEFAQLKGFEVVESKK